MSDMTGFTQAAREGVVTVVFKKIFDGEIRVMPCTLNVELSNHNVPEIMEQKETNDHLVVWVFGQRRVAIISSGYCD